MNCIFDKDFLINLYNTNGKNCAEVSRILGVNNKTVRKYLNGYGVDTSGHRHVDRYSFLPDYLLAKYIECNCSSAKLAAVLGVSQPTVKRHLSLHNIDSSINIGNRKHFFNESFFNVIDTEEKAYWLGFIIADGCIGKGSDKWSYRLYINLSVKDLNHLKLFLKSLNADYNIRIINSKEHGNVKSTKIASVKVNSTRLCKDLLSIGITTKKSLNESFPNIPSHLYAHFIRGYFDGDGSIYKSRRSQNEWRFSLVGSAKLLNDIAFNLPVKANIYYKHTSKSGDILDNLVVSKHDYLATLYYYLYGNSTIFLSRKKIIFDHFINQIPNLIS